MSLPRVGGYSHFVKPAERKDNMFQLTIVKADNGFVLRYFNEEMNEDRFVSVEDPPDGNEVETAEKMLWEVIEFFGLQGSKHDPERIKVTREKKL